MLLTLICIVCFVVGLAMMLAQRPQVTTTTRPRLHAYNAGHGEYVPAPHLVEHTYFYDDDLLTVEDYKQVVTGTCVAMGVPREEIVGLLREMEEDVEWYVIVLISEGNRRAAFESLLKMVEFEPSGDDDTYDYWPSGVRFAAQLADGEKDLRRLRSQTVEIIVARGLEGELLPGSLDLDQKPLPRWWERR